MREADVRANSNAVAGKQPCSFCRGVAVHVNIALRLKVCIASARPPKRHQEP